MLHNHNYRALYLYTHHSCLYKNTLKSNEGFQNTVTYTCSLDLDFWHRSFIKQSFDIIIPTLCDSGSVHAAKFMQNVHHDIICVLL